MPIASGTKLGSYEIVGLLGAGGMGEVYRARDARLDREVAIKVLPAQFAADAAMMARFEREAKTVATLSHPNILAIHDFGTEDGRVYAVTELLEGVTLRERLEDGPLGTRKAVELGCQIARGLGAAHAGGVVHRDLKPDNVMIAADGRAKILDFGLAARREESEDSGPRSAQTPTRTSLTDPGTVLGTVGYMSPEQVRGEVADARSDIFSFGAVLYEVITGKRAFTYETAAETMTAILREDPLESVGSGMQVSPALLSVVRRCLEKQPEERFSSAADIAFALEAAVQVSSIESGPRVADLARSPTKRSSWLSVVGALLLAVAAFAAGWVLAPDATVGGEASALATLDQLTFEDGIEGHPTISPDGRRIAYVVMGREAPGGPRARILVQRVGGTNPIDVTPSGGFQPAFSPDGERIAYATDRGVFVMGATGESARRVTEAGFNPAWSPDGRWLLVNDESIGDPYGRQDTSNLWKVDVATGARTKIEIEGQVDGVQGTWSPDGSRIAFWGMPAGTGKRVLFTVPAEGGRAVALTDDDAINWNPRWSPDGRRLYFGSDRGGNMNIWVMSIDPGSGAAVGSPRPASISTERVGRFDIASNGSIAFASRSTSTSILRRKIDLDRMTVSEQAEPLLTGGRRVANGRVSPDGQWVAYTADNGMEDLYVLSTAGSGLRRLTNDSFKDRAPTWSGDSGRLFFFSTRSGRYEAWSIGVDGGDPRQITRTAQGVMYNPVPSPDGTRLLVHKAGQAALMNLDNELPILDSEDLPPVEGDIGFFGSDWSPDSRRIVGTQWPRFDQVYVYSLDDRSYTRMTDDVRSGRTFWLPDGRKLIYTKDGSIWVHDLDRGASVQVLDGVAGLLAGYADGYVYSVEGSEASDIWLLRE